MKIKENNALAFPSKIEDVMNLYPKKQFNINKLHNLEGINILNEIQLQHIINLMHKNNPKCILYKINTKSNSWAIDIINILNIIIFSK